MRNPFENYTSEAPIPNKNRKAEQKEKREKARFEMTTATRGKKERIQNEDQAYIDPQRGMFFVADGTGGSKLGGGLASKAVVASVMKNEIKYSPNQLIRKIFLSDVKQPQTQTEVEKATKELVEQNMYDHVARFRGSSDTTITLGKIWENEEGEKKLTIVNAGDSRMYRFREGKLEQLTEDDSVIQKIIEQEIPDTDGFPIVDEKDISRAVHVQTLKTFAEQEPIFYSMLTYAKRQSEKEDRKINKLTLEEMRHFVLKTVLYPENLKVASFDVKKADIYLTMSDGIHDNLTDTEINEVIKKYKHDIAHLSDALIESAVRISQDEKNPRHKADDMTVSVVKINK